MTTKRQVLAVLLAASYFGLVVVSAVCLFGVSPVGTGTHHHHTGPVGKVAHSPLCAWACQAVPVAVLIGPSTVPFAFIVLWATVITALASLSQNAWAPAFPRSPPVPLR